MNRVICDTCVTQAPLDSFGRPPKGWLRVTRFGALGAPQDYCSLNCAVAALSVQNDQLVEIVEPRNAEVKE